MAKKKKKKKKKKRTFYKRLHWRFLIVQHTDKAVEREVAYFLKCDWLAFLRYSGVGQRI